MRRHCCLIFSISRSGKVHLLNTQPRQLDVCMDDNIYWPNLPPRWLEDWSAEEAVGIAGKSKPQARLTSWVPFHEFFSPIQASSCRCTRSHTKKSRNLYHPSLPDLGRPWGRGPKAPGACSSSLVKRIIWVWSFCRSAFNQFSRLLRWDLERKITMNKRGRLADTQP